MKVLVSDRLADIGIEIFKKAKDVDVDVKIGLQPEELKGIIKDYDALVIRSATKVTEDILNAATRLRVIGRAGIGLDNVDIPAATKRGVVVMNTPAGNVITTAEHAIAMMLALSRNIPQGTASLKAGRWEKKDLRGREVFNKTLGVLGCGRIGSIVADLAKGLKMKVIVYDQHVNKEPLEQVGLEVVSLDDLFKRSDYITIHLSKSKETTNLLNKEAFDQMKPGVMIINCARGGIVNEKDLAHAIKSGTVAGAALDVFETEPPGSNPLFEFDNVICTPHLGASTVEAQTNVAVDVAEQIISYLQTDTIINAANVPSVAGELLVKLQPYLTLAERMGCFQAQLTTGPIKEVAVKYQGDFFGLDMAPVTTAALKGLLTVFLKDEVNFVNTPVIVKERGIKVVESRSVEAEDFTSLITIQATGSQGSNTVSGTIFGKHEPRIVRVNTFRLEVIPEGHLLFIHNIDEPGAIGSIGTVLGQHNINIGRMHVGQEKVGVRNVVLLVTDTPTPPETLKELQALPLVKSVISLEL
ncbi:MAG: phosphoglycerate dehydrogenase [Desulfobacterales bacterium S3730MH5]|nr:MAG: phosphoglycerate dehydrogenase [Desulfobacterales bacterium S3730MH5]OEU83269.1 MAG: phosphoglycerate dehydrogenase [Desulfobacterales bacterium S5133MH4]